jgi:hypothetical protein
MVKVMVHFPFFFFHIGSSRSKFSSEMRVSSDVSVISLVNFLERELKRFKSLSCFGKLFLSSFSHLRLPYRVVMNFAESFTTCFEIEGSRLKVAAMTVHMTKLSA